MKKIFSGLIAIASVIPAAYAMDEIWPAPCGPCYEIDEFRGFYALAHVGVASNFYGYNFLDNNISVTDRVTDVTAGVGVGYDWQCSNFLLGLVSDWNWLHIRPTFQMFPNVNIYFKNRIKWLSTIRARTGIVFCNALFYLTAGGSVIKVDKTIHSEIPEEPLFHLRRSRWRWGWVAGVGTEFLLSCRWSLGAELLFSEFDGSTDNFTLLSPTSVNSNQSLTTGRITLNYRFGSRLL